MVDEFTQLGHTLAGCGRNQTVLDELGRAFSSGYFAKVDVSNDEQVSAFCQAAAAQVGPPDLLINNASIINKPAPLWEVSADEFDLVMAINVNGAANVIRHAVPLMAECRTGVVVNLSSGWGRSTSADVAPYCASKWAIEGMTQALAQEVPNGVAAVALNPGVINTGMLQRCWGEGAESYQSPQQWAAKAAPFLLGLSADDNGSSLTAP